jgi:hypothetical protein
LLSVALAEGKEKLPFLAALIGVMPYLALLATTVSC